MISSNIVDLPTSLQDQSSQTATEQSAVKPATTVTFVPFNLFHLDELEETEVEFEVFEKSECGNSFEKLYASYIGGPAGADYVYVTDYDGLSAVYTLEEAKSRLFVLGDPEPEPTPEEKRLAELEGLEAEAERLILYLNIYPTEKGHSGLALTELEHADSVAGAFRLGNAVQLPLLKDPIDGNWYIDFKRLALAYVGFAEEVMGLDRTDAILRVFSWLDRDND